MIWSGAGLHGTLLVGWLVTLFGIDPDKSSILFLLVFAPVILVAGIVFWILAGHLQHHNVESNMLLRLFRAAKCDLTAPPMVFFIPMPLLSCISLLAAFIIWLDIFK